MLVPETTPTETPSLPPSLVIYHVKCVCTCKRGSLQQGEEVISCAAGQNTSPQSGTAASNMSNVHCLDPSSETALEQDVAIDSDLSEARETSCDDGLEHSDPVAISSLEGQNPACTSAAESHDDHEIDVSSEQTEIAAISYGQDSTHSHVVAGSPEQTPHALQVDVSVQADATTYAQNQGRSESDVAAGSLRGRRRLQAVSQMIATTCALFTFLYFLLKCAWELCCRSAASLSSLGSSEITILLMIVVLWLFNRPFFEHRLHPYEDQARRMTTMYARAREQQRARAARG